MTPITQVMPSMTCRKVAALRESIFRMSEPERDFDTEQAGALCIVDSIFRDLDQINEDIQLAEKEN